MTTNILDKLLFYKFIFNQKKVFNFQKTRKMFNKTNVLNRSYYKNNSLLCLQMQV